MQNLEITYLSGVANELIEPATTGRTDVGLIVGPGGGTYSKIDRYPVFGADNGCFSKGDRFDAAEWLAWLDRLPRSSCLFSVAPDVVGDAAATISRSAEWLPVIRSMGFPAAFVAQDGLEDLEIPWSSFDVLFLGGSTEYKLSSHGLSLAREARARGKRSHMGRVNSLKRLKIALEAGFDSADGTFVGFAPTQNSARMLRWMEELNGPVPCSAEELAA